MMLEFSAGNPLLEHLSYWAASHNSQIARLVKLMERDSSSYRGVLDDVDGFLVCNDVPQPV